MGEVRCSSESGGHHEHVLSIRICTRRDVRTCSHHEPLRMSCLLHKLFLVPFPCVQQGVEFLDDSLSTLNVEEMDELYKHFLMDDFPEV